jgi:hypothetical protein
MSRGKVIELLMMKIYSEINGKLAIMFSRKKDMSKDINYYLGTLSAAPSIDPSPPLVICAIDCMLRFLANTGHGSVLTLENYINYANREGHVYEMKTHPDIGHWFIRVASYQHKIHTTVRTQMRFHPAHSVLALFHDHMTSSLADTVALERRQRVADALSPERFAHAVACLGSPLAAFESAFGPDERALLGARSASAADPLLPDALYSSSLSGHADDDDDDDAEDEEDDGDAEDEEERSDGAEESDGSEGSAHSTSGPMYSTPAAQA